MKDELKSAQKTCRMLARGMVEYEKRYAKKGMYTEAISCLAKSNAYFYVGNMIDEMIESRPARKPARTRKTAKGGGKR